MKAGSTRTVTPGVQRVIDRLENASQELRWIRNNNNVLDVAELERLAAVRHDLAQLRQSIIRRHQSLQEGAQGL